MLALMGLMFAGGMTKTFAQDDSAKVAEEPKDTISIDDMDPVYYEEESKDSSNTMIYEIVGGILVVGGAAFFLIRKKKK